MKKCAVILSGCGLYDGSEIHESTLLSYFLDLHDISITFLAPNIDQADCIDHSTGKAMANTSRNCLIESARIARGPVNDINEKLADEFDMAIFSGGYGAAKNLSTFAIDNENLSINLSVKNFILAMNKKIKPLGFLCISPVIAAKLFPKLKCTLGLDQSNLDILTKMGASAIQANYDDVVFDAAYNIYSTPAYMIDTSISKIALGIEKLVVSIKDSL
jgi:enhancing lycopene biosynthesis protein 2